MFPMPAMYAGPISMLDLLTRSCIIIPVVRTLLEEGPDLNRKHSLIVGAI